VRDLSAAGSGVVEHPSGRICFVPGVWTGEYARFRLRAVRGRSGHAELLELLEPSAHRISAPCRHHGQGAAACGGCPWQFMDYSAQLAAKQDRVAGALRRLGLDSSVAPIIPSPRTLGYRNRARLRTDGRAIGYLAAGSNRLAAVEDCPILNEHNRRTLHTLRAMLPRQDWRPARGAPLTILHIDDEINAEALEPGQQRPFRQGNSEQNRRMQRWLAEQLAEQHHGHCALELFAGSGNFTRVLAEAGLHRVHAVDAAGAAIDALRAQALPGVTVQTLDIYSPGALRGLGAVLPQAELLLLDPPREGLRNIEELLETASALREIIYISCDLPSFSRDLGTLLAQGFTLEALQPLDMFPHTPHVELLARLQRR